jgi:hypothetical protein
MHITKELDIYQKINDIRTSGKMTFDLMPHFTVKKLMGPPELISKKNEALIRQMLNPMKGIKYALPLPTKLHIPKQSPLKIPYKNIQEAAQKIISTNKLVFPSLLPDTKLQTLSKLIKQVKPIKPLSVPKVKSKPTIPPTMPTKKQTKNYINSTSHITYKSKITK